MARKDEELEISQDLKHSRLEWRIERIGWVVIALILIAALVGLLGPGPLSSTTVGSQTGFWGEYDRFARYNAPHTIRLHFRSAGTDSLLRIRLSREFVDNVDEMEIIPEPARTTGESGHISYYFTRGDSIRTSGDSLTVTFNYRPQTFGDLRFDAEDPSRTVLHFNQFVYP